MIAEHNERLPLASAKRFPASNTRRYAGLAYAVVAYVMAIAYWPIFICFIGNLPRISDPLLARTVSAAPTILPTWQALAINLCLIGAFALHHSFLARSSVKKIWGRYVPEPFRRSTFTHVANLFAYALVFHWQPIPIVLWHFDHGSVLKTAILPVFFLGWIMLLLGARSFNVSALFGLRQAWFWFKGKPYEPINITASRSYNLARHPEFLGLFLGIWVTADMTVGHLLLAASFTGYSLVALRIKENELGKAFGSSFTSYKARVPMLGPHWLTAVLIALWLVISGAEIAQTMAQRRHDIQARADVHRLKQALIAYRAEHGSYPPSHEPACEHPDHKHAYDELMARLTSAGLLEKPLTHPSRRRMGLGYCYWEASENGKVARVVGTQLPSSPLSNTGEPGGCRPFQKLWICSHRANQDYCLCMP